MRPLWLEGMWGLGDNIYQRIFVRAAAAQRDVYLDTPWPELYADLPIKFVRNRQREGKLRTQTKNMRAQPAGRWSHPPATAQRLRVGYGGADLVRGGIVKTLDRQLPLGRVPFVMDLPDMGPAPRLEWGANSPIALIRPVTVRREWRNEARNPRPEYIAALATRLMDTHCVVSVADLKPGEEWLGGDAPPAHVRFHGGELSVREMLALTRDADIVVGGVGWIVPATLALKTRAFIVLGGHGAHNAPEVITDPRIDLSRIGFAMPDKFCRCTNMLHKCDKTISDLDAQFERWESNAQSRAA